MKGRGEGGYYKKRPGPGIGGLMLVLGLIVVSLLTVLLVDR